MKTKNDGEPQEILMPVLREASSWGENDPKILKPYLFAKDIVPHLELDDVVKAEIDFLADRLLDKLESALMYYQMIAADDFDERNISQKRTIYEGLYANLWSFHKGRVQNYLRKMGWNLAVFFCKDENFNKEAAKFIKDNPEHKAIVEMARKQREAWQSDFALSRNVSEHSGDYRNGAQTYEAKGDAQRLFAQVCWTAETLIAYCGSYKMTTDWNIIEIDSKTNVFLPGTRYIIERALQTEQRMK